MPSVGPRALDESGQELDGVLLRAVIGSGPVRRAEAPVPELYDPRSGIRGRPGCPARLIRATDVIAVGVNTQEDGGQDIGGKPRRAVVEPLWGGFDAALTAISEALTVEDPLKRAAKAGPRKAVTEPLNFVI